MLNGLKQYNDFKQYNDIKRCHGIKCNNDWSSGLQNLMTKALCSLILNFETRILFAIV